MSPAEARELVADLTDDTPAVMPDGRMRGQDWRPAGVNRRGVTRTDDRGNVLADVQWYETAMEMFERSAA